MVYVDDMAAKFGRMIMCHMIADSREELDSMADRIGMNRKWIQKANTHQEHYDICRAMRIKAVAFGAIEISLVELVRKCGARRIGKCPTK